MKRGGSKGWGTSGYRDREPAAIPQPIRTYRDGGHLVKVYPPGCASGYSPAWAAWLADGEISGS